MAITIYPCNGGNPVSPTYQATVHRRVRNDRHYRFTPTSGSLKSQYRSTISNHHIYVFEIIAYYSGAFYALSSACGEFFQKNINCLICGDKEHAVLL